MTKQEEFNKVIKTIANKRQASLDKKGAVDMIAGQEFIGYIGQTDNQWWCDIYSWGINHGKIFGATRKRVEEMAFKAFPNYINRSE